MRTVSFSQAKIRKSLNNNFICHAINTEGDASSGQSQAHAPKDKAGPCSDGVGNQNVQLLFLTPEGEIFHTVSGFRGPDTLEDELEFSQRLFAQIQEKPDTAKTLVRTMHRQRESIASNSRTTRSKRSRSRSRSGGGGGGGIRRARQLDSVFADRYPMMSIETFNKNPRRLVGSGSTVFVSGTSSGGTIGG